MRSKESRTGLRVGNGGGRFFQRHVRLLRLVLLAGSVAMARFTP